MERIIGRKKEIPYYLSMLKKGESIAANIDNLFFAKGAKLRNEFDNLFASQFADSESLKSIVKLLTKKKEGFTRKEAIEVSGRERLYTSLSKLQRFQKKLKVQVDRPIPSLLSPVQGEYDQRTLLAREPELRQTECLARFCL